MVLAGRYQVEAVLGKGGSGIVVRAFDRTAQMVVAVKVLKQDLVHDQRWSKRFSRELRLGRPIRHPNVCRIFDIGEGDGHRFLTMELATGGTLRDLIKRNEPLRSLPERMADAEAAIAGLAAIHEAGIVHRDVKPDNMLRMDDGRLVISDFGLATDLPTATAVTVLVGTPHYMAPEIRAGEPATTRSDVWSLGVALYEIFFGKRPERRSSFSSEGMSKPPAPLTSTPVERAMLALAERCLSENPLERPSDAAAVQRLFKSAQTSPRRFGRRRVFPLLASSLLVAAAAGIVARGVRGGRVQSPPLSGSGQVVELQPSGKPVDWTDGAKVITTVPGKVHCFSTMNSTALLVWGSPRQAEDVDLQSGARTPSRLSPETYSVGCPQWSRQRNALLFTEPTGNGANEIRLSSSPDGSNAQSITPGFDPRWISIGDDFVYALDDSHAAVFNLPTMRFALLPDPGLGRRPVISQIAASSRSNLIALLVLNEDSKWAISVFGGPALERLATFFVRPAQGLHFDDATERLLLPDNYSAALATLTLVDWKSGHSKHIGRFRGLEPVDAQTFGNETLVLARHRSRNAWLYDGATSRQLTFDGQVHSAAISPSGDLLVARIGDDGDLSIWREGHGTRPNRVTSGTDAARPAFSADGRSWAYIDYGHKSLVLCSTASWTCAPVRSDENLPEYPVFSPDGEKIAYVTMANVPRLMVVSIKDGAVQQVGPTQRECPPVWSSVATLWTLEGTPRRYVWVERGLDGARTGNRIERDAETDLTDGDCSSPRDPAGSLFSPKLRLQAAETSHLIRVSSDQVH